MTLQRFVLLVFCTVVITLGTSCMANNGPDSSVFTDRA